MPSNLTIDDIANRLGVRPSASRPKVNVMSDPVAEQQMMLDVLGIRPYESNPRLTRNPLYDEIKESIRQRRLQQPLIVTRRPSEEHYIVARGGNTRLQILQELQQECPDGRFDKVLCLFTPWVSEIQTLSSHLIENEQRGQLLFIEKALAVDNLRKLYEAETNRTFTQAELAQRLAGDGIKVSQPLISRMRDTLSFLFPAIPNLFHQGLNTEAVKKLIIFHNNCEKAWNEFASQARPATDFDRFYHDALAGYNVTLEGFSIRVVEDELIGKMAQALGQTYGTIEVIVREDESRAGMRNLFLSMPVEKFKPLEVPPPVPSAPADSVPCSPTTSPSRISKSTNSLSPANEEAAQENRLHSIKHLIEEQIGSENEDAAPAQFDELSDAHGHDSLSEKGVWEIAPEEDDRSSLRSQIAQLACEIAELTEPEARICRTGVGAGYEFRSPGLEAWDRWSAATRMTMLLLRDLSGRGTPRPIAQIGGLLCGLPCQGVARVSDEVFCKFIRLLRLLRRLVEHGNADIWDGQAISTESADDMELSNGNP
jgi:ParB family protein of integrating conjugative element (PFGI_1 class)